jgi:hypothetical protein
MTELKNKLLNAKEIAQRDALKNVYIENDLHSIENEVCQVDVLQYFLEENGFKPLDPLKHGCWYRNVISEITGYVAYMRVLSPDNQVWSITVDSLGDKEDVIRNVKKDVDVVGCPLMVEPKENGWQVYHPDIEDSVLFNEEKKKLTIFSEIN